MATVFYVKGNEVTVDDIDADLLEKRWKCHGQNKIYVGYNKYVAGKFKTVLIHRVIMARVLGRELSSSENVDHADLNPFNNQRKNLRLATTSQNLANSRMRSNNTSGIKGVYFREGRYYARIMANYKMHNLGGFGTPEEAQEAYKQAAIKYFGEFARW